MISEAYALSLIAVLAALSYCTIRASKIRPNTILAVGVVGVFFIGCVIGRMSSANEDWARAGKVSVPAQLPPPAAAVAYLAASSTGYGLPAKSGKIAVDVFDEAAKGTRGNRDSVELVKGAALQVAGWAVDEKANAPCKALYLAVDKQRFVVPYGGPRPDVAAYFRNAAFTETGFNAQVPTDNIPKGTHFVDVECLSIDGKTLFTPSHHPRVVVVR